MEFYKYTLGTYRKISMKELERLLKENSGLLSRMKERDGNEKLNKICEEIFKKDLTNSHK